MMTEASEEVLSVVEELSVAEGLPAVESAEGPGDLASHGERDTTLATPATEKDTTQATQASEKDTTQVLEKVTDTEWPRKLLSFHCQSRANLQGLKESVSTILSHIFASMFKFGLRLYNYC